MSHWFPKKSDEYHHCIPGTHVCWSKHKSTIIFHETWEWRGYKTPQDHIFPNTRGFLQSLYPIRSSKIDHPLLAAIPPQEARRAPHLARATKNPRNEAQLVDDEFGFFFNEYHGDLMLI